MTCEPVPPASQSRVDINNAASCIDAASQLLQAYYKVIGGTQRVVVRFGERWTEYGRGNAEELKRAYIALYNQCPAAKAGGLPDLSGAARVQRGGPARGFHQFGRL